MNELSPRHEAFAQLIADRVAELVIERIGQPEVIELLEAKEVAELLRISPAAVRAMANAGQLPVIRLGDSARPRLRFDPRAVAEALAANLVDNGGADAVG